MTRAELHKIQHKSIQVIAEGIGLANYFRNFQCNVCLRKIKTVCRHTLFEFLSGRIGSSGAHKRTLVAGEKRAKLRRSAGRQQFIIKVSSWRFYNRQEEVLNQKSPKVIDRFVFNYLAVDNANQIASTKAAWFFLSFFWRVRPTSRWEMTLFRTNPLGKMRPHPAAHIHPHWHLIRKYPPWQGTWKFQKCHCFSGNTFSTKSSFVVWYKCLNTKLFGGFCIYF